MIFHFDEVNTHMRRIDYDKYYSGTQKSLDVLGTAFPLLESGLDVIECQGMVIQ